MTLTTDHNQPVSKEGMLRAIAAELQLLSVACSRIESALGQVMIGRSPTEKKISADLQDIDRVKQTLDDLGPLLMGLATDDAGTDLELLFEDLRLMDLRLRIGEDRAKTRSSALAQPVGVSGNGSVDWF